MKIKIGDIVAVREDFNPNSHPGWVRHQGKIGLVVGDSSAEVHVWGSFPCLIVMLGSGELIDIPASLIRAVSRHKGEENVNVFC